MAIRLIDPNATHPVTVEGTTFYVATLNNGQKIDLAEKIQHLKDGDEAFNELLRLVSQYVTRVEGFEDVETFDVLVNMASLESQQAVLGAVTEFNTLSGEQEKNSESSSGTPTLSPTGDGQGADTADRDDASTTDE